MGYDLTNAKGEYFRFRSDMFPKMFQIACLYGWEPAGTVEGFRRPIHDTDGNETGEYLEWDADDYLSNAGQVVTASDANALADALERALPFLGDENRLPMMVHHVERAEPTATDLEQAKAAYRSMSSTLNRLHRFVNEATDVDEEERANTLKLLGGAPPELEAEEITVMRGRDFYIGMKPPTVLVLGENDMYTPMPIDEYSGDRKDYLGKFINFCREGGFTIA